MAYLALDPNVLLAAALGHPDSEQLLEQIVDKADFIRLVIDEGSEHIRSVYDNVLEDPNLRDKLQWVSSAIDRGRLAFKRLPAHKADTHKQWLADNGFGAPVEPELIALAADAPRKIYLVVCGKEYWHPLWGQRGMHDSAHCQLLGAEPDFSRVSAYKAWEADRRLASWIRTDPLYPGTHHELEEFLHDQKYTENTQLEFKQPCDQQKQPTSGYLTRSILEKAMKGICGLSNARGGILIVGVYEDKERGRPAVIHGFQRSYYKGKEVSPLDDDKLQQILAMYYLSRFTPEFNPDELRWEIVELQGELNGRIAIVFHVQRWDGRRCYDNQYCIRIANTTQCWPATCP
jgi:hypothetical protein